MHTDGPLFLKLLLLSYLYIRERDVDMIAENPDALFDGVWKVCTVGHVKMLSDPPRLDWTSQGHETLQICKSHQI